jgi:hypothetical protein
MHKIARQVGDKSTCGGSLTPTCTPSIGALRRKIIVRKASSNAATKPHVLTNRGGLGPSDPVLSSTRYVSAHIEGM